MKYLLFFAALLGVSFGAHANANGANAEAKRFRWIPRLKSLPSLVNAKFERLLDRQPELFPVVVPLNPRAQGELILPAKGERVLKAEQRVGPAVVDGTWTQTIFQPDGRVAYSAGAVFEQLPEDEWLGRVLEMNNRKDIALRVAEQSPEYRHSSRRSEPEIRLRRGADGNFESYWRMEYVNQTQDKVQFLHVGEAGNLLETGEMAVPAADGKALVFPLGPKMSELTEVPLRQLSGDGTLSSRFFRITSALNLDVRSPNLLFFFPETDRRFDLSQVYFTIEKSLEWMRKFLGVELKLPLEVRLHIGENGVSNAAFYHDNIIYLGSGDGVTYKDLTRDPSVVTHESIHAMIDSYAGLPSEGEGGSFNEGFADLFTALILDNPHMGSNSYVKGPYRRTLENDLKAYRDFTNGVYRNGSVVAATFWDMRSGIANDKLAQLAFRTLVRLGRGAKFEDFVPAVQHAADGLLNLEEQEVMATKLADRGWAGQ